MKIKAHLFPIQRLNDWKNSTRCKFRRSQNGEKGISITALEKKALALFGTAPYTSTVCNNVKIESKQQANNTSTTDSEHNAEVENMLQEVEFATEEVEPENHIIVRKRSISGENHSSHNPKNIKIEKKHPTINKKTIIFDFDASDENLDEDMAHIIVEDVPKLSGSQKQSRHVEETMEHTNFLSPKKITLNPQPSSSESGFQSSIAYQLKRIADVKEEKLMFEIAKYKYNNPGFKYDYQGTAGVSEEQHEDVLVYSEEHY